MFELRTTRPANAVRPYDPFREMEEFERRFFGSPFEMRAPECAAPFKTDVRDNGDSYLIEADLPGVAKENIRLELNGDTLTVRAERHSEHEDKDKRGNYLRCERSYGAYARSFDVSAVNTGDIRAKYADGVLTVTLPKREEKKPETRVLEIEG